MTSPRACDGDDGRAEGAVLGDRAGRDRDRGRTHRAASDQETAVRKKVVEVTRRKIDAFVDPVSEVVVNMDRLEEEVAPHAHGSRRRARRVRRRRGSAKMPEEEVRKIEIAYPQAFRRAAKAGGARVCGVMTAAGANPESRMKYAKIIGEKEEAVESVKFDFLGLYCPAAAPGNSNTPGVLGYVTPLLHWAMLSKYHSIHKNDLARAMVAQSEQAFLGDRAGQRSQESDCEYPRSTRRWSPSSSRARSTSLGSPLEQPRDDRTTPGERGNCGRPRPAPFRDESLYPLQCCIDQLNQHPKGLRTNARVEL